jgi:hypothetical protein
VHRCKNLFSLFAKGITSVCFFINKWTINKLPFAQSANGKRIKEYRLGFRFPYEMATYKFEYKYTHTRKWNLRKMATAICLQQTEIANFLFLLQLEIENGSLFSLVGK